jgi:Tfp pilus assembly protein PilO
MTRKNSILLSVVALVAAVAAFYFLVLSPKREEIAKLDKDIAAQEAAVEQARLTLAGYEEAKASYKRNYATLARLGKAVPADDDVRSLMVQLESTADRSGVDFQKIELSSGLGGDAPTAAAAPADSGGTELAAAPGTVPVAGGVLSAMPFSFTFTGSYFDLSAFFARLEHFVSLQNRRLDATGRLLRLESISISPSTIGFPDMEAEINAASYLVPPVQGVEGAAPATPPAEGTTQATQSTTTASAPNGAAQ